MIGSILPPSTHTQQESSENETGHSLQGCGRAELGWGTAAGGTELATPGSQQAERIPKACLGQGTSAEARPVGYMSHGSKALRGKIASAFSSL